MLIFRVFFTKADFRREVPTQIRSHPKTWFVTRSSEEAVVKAGGEKGSEAC